jgi:NitT/TauT family transport system substrate-binding protein
VAEELLQGEGFTEVQYVQQSIGEAERSLVSREVDLSTVFSEPCLLRLEAGDPLVMLAGLHVGCFTLFGTERWEIDLETTPCNGIDPGGLGSGLA